MSIIPPCSQPSARPGESAFCAVGAGERTTSAAGVFGEGCRVGAFVCVCAGALMRGECLGVVCCSGVCVLRGGVLVKVRAQGWCVSVCWCVGEGCVLRGAC